MVFSYIYFQLKWKNLRYLQKQADNNFAYLMDYANEI